MYTLIYFFKKAFQGFSRHKVLAALSIFTITLTFYIFSLILLFYQNFNLLLETWGENIQVSIFLADDITADERLKLERLVQGFAETESFKFVSKDEALASFKDNLEYSDAVLEGLNENPLPASYDVKIKKAYRNHEIVKNFAFKLKELPKVTDVVYGRDWIERFSKFVSFFRNISGAMGMALLIASVLIISNTIKLTFISRQEEINIMELFGATNTFIKLPFYLEGTLIGICGSILSIILVTISYKFVSQNITYFLTFSKDTIIFKFLTAATIIKIVLSGILIGILSTFFSVSKTVKRL